eukprot:SAG11_NODE_1096_length_5884_cov_4.310631_1_plen_207_part_00
MLLLLHLLLLLLPFALLLSVRGGRHRPAQVGTTNLRVKEGDLNRQLLVPPPPPPPPVRLIVKTGRGYVRGGARVLAALGGLGKTGQGCVRGGARVLAALGGLRAGGAVRRRASARSTAQSCAGSLTRWTTTAAVRSPTHCNSDALMLDGRCRTLGPLPASRLTRQETRNAPEAAGGQGVAAFAGVLLTLSTGGPTPARQGCWTERR